MSTSGTSVLEFPVHAASSEHPSPIGKNDHCIQDDSGQGNEKKDILGKTEEG